MCVCDFDICMHCETSVVDATFICMHGGSFPDYNIVIVNDIVLTCGVNHAWLLLIRSPGKVLDESLFCWGDLQ